MEHDVTLMRQLISLQESVEQLKSYRQQPQLSPAGSTQSLSEDLDSLSLAGDSVSGQRQYFSRQNSILRIPIPPRRDVKLRTIVDDPDETSSGVSSSDGTFKPEKSVRPKSLVISTDSDCHSRQSSGDTPNSPESSQPRPIRLKNSFDSGIHLSQDVVYVWINFFLLTWPQQQ